MNLAGKKLGLLISAAPNQPNFSHAIEVAAAGLSQGVIVYAYCTDDAVRGLEDARLQALKPRGLNLYACAYSAQNRQIPLSDAATFAGLTVVSDVMSATDRFLSFN